jgi:hypothetical protein
VDEELEPLDPGDWADDAQEPSEGVPTEPERPAATVRGLVSRHRGASLAALVVTAAGLITWGVLAHHRHQKHGPTGAVTLTTALAGQRGTALVTDLARHREDAVVAQFSQALSARLDALGLKADWLRVVTAYGQLKHAGTPTVNGDGVPFFAVIVPIDLAKGRAVVGITYLPTGAITSLGFSPAAVPNPPSLSPAYDEPRASAVVHDLATGADAAVLDQLDPLARAATTAEAVRRAWNNFEAAYGDFVSAGPAASVSPYLVDDPVHWARGVQSVVVVSFDGNGQVDGLALLRSDAPTEASYLSPLPLTPAASQVAIAVCRELAAQDYASVTGRFDPLAVAANAQQPVQAAWEHVTAKLGRLRGIGAPAVLGDGGDEIIYEVDLTFDHGHAHVQVGVDNNFQVQVLLILAGLPTRTAAT